MGLGAGFKDLVFEFRVKVKSLDFMFVIQSHVDTLRYTSWRSRIKIVSRLKNVAAQGSRAQWGLG